MDNFCWPERGDVASQTASKPEFQAQKRDQMKFDQTSKVARIPPLDIPNLFLIDALPSRDAHCEKNTFSVSRRKFFAFPHPQFKVKQLISSINDLCSRR